MSGFGSFSYGSTPYGLNTPAVAPTSGGAIWRDPFTGESTGSPLIDPDTGDYVYDEYGRAQGMDDVRHLVLLAVSTTKGTAAMRTLGQELRKIERITPNIQRRVENTLREAVQHIVDRGFIEVVGVRVQQVKEGAILVHFEWRNLVTGVTDEAFIDPAR